MEKRELVPVKDKSLFTREAFEEPKNFVQLLDACKILVASKILPKEIDTSEKAAVVILTGRELGLRMMASTRGIYVVNGKPSLSAQMMLSLAYNTGQVEDIEIVEKGSGKEASCTVTVKRRGKKAYSYTFTCAMAEKMGKYVNEWLKQPENMCKQRAISGNLRVTFPDAILGMYTPEEIETIDITPVKPLEPEMPRAKDTPKEPEKKPKAEKEAPKPETAAVASQAAQESKPEASEEAGKTAERPTPAGYEVLKAVQDGKCKGCQKVISNGTEFVFSAKKGSFHTDCAE